MKNSKHKMFKWLTFTLLLSLLFNCSNDDDNSNSPPMEAWEIEVEQVRASTLQYASIEVATNEGFFDASGFVPNMGYHYILPPRFEDGFDLTKPEILLYAPDENGIMEFVAIEFGMVVQDPENPGNPPEGFTGDIDVWHFNHELSQWQLHVWINKENPDGIFTALNPDLN